MPDIQTNEAVENAKQRLRQLEEQQESSGRSPEGATAGKDAPRTKADIIRSVSAKPKKKKFSTKLKEAFFGENIGDGSITENIFFRIFIPNLKRVLSEMANSAINSALGLDSRTRTISGSVNTHQANASVYRDRNYNRVNSVGSARRCPLSEMEWSEADATDIYNQIQDIFDQFPEEGLNMADVYTIMGEGAKVRATDYYWGWTSIRGIEMNCIDKMNDIWVIDMPPARALNR